MKKFAAAALLAVGLAGSANAALVNAPVAANAYITVGAYDWAWAAPVAADGSWGTGAVDLSFQSAYGWRLPTLAELALAPVGLDFVFVGANVPAGSSDPATGATFYGSNSGAAACATPYFNNNFSHCDYYNGVGIPGNNVDGWWAPGRPSYYDTLVIRDHVEVPEPGALLLVGLGLFGLASARRRKIS